MLRLSYLMAIVPIAALLTASFFVLFTLRKIEEKGLRAFGCVVVGLLWLATLVVFSGAVYKMAQGSYAMECMMYHKMSMDYMPSRMPKHNLLQITTSEQVSPEQAPPVKEQKLSSCSKCRANKGIVFKSE